MKCSFFNMLSEMDGSNFQISNFMKMQYILLSVPLDDCITVLQFFHWLTSRCNASAGLIFSSITLLIFPSSPFKGLMRQHGKLAWKVSLWSFRVKSADFLHNTILAQRGQIFFASKLIFFSKRSVCLLSLLHSPSEAFYIVLVVLCIYIITLVLKYEKILWGVCTWHIFFYLFLKVASRFFILQRANNIMQFFLKCL